MEEIAAAFGDRVILPGERDDGKDDDDDGEKPDSQRVEVAVPVKDGDWFGLVIWVLFYTAYVHTKGVLCMRYDYN